MSKAWIRGMGLKTGLGLGVRRNFSAMEAGLTGIETFPTNLSVSLWPEQRELWHRENCLGCSKIFDAVVDEVLQEAVPANFDWSNPRTCLWVATTKDNIFNLERDLRLGHQAQNDARLGATASRLATRHSLRGHVQTISTACASGSIALGLAAEAIRQGRCDQAIVLGVDAVSSFILEGFASFHAISATPCRPFDRDRNGLSPGSAAAAMVLSNTPGDAPVYVGAWASSNDANHVTGPSRDGLPLALCLNKVFAQDGEKPHCILAHGTGTPYNDAMEAKAFLKVYEDAQPQLCCIKGNVGHCMGAAGVVEGVMAAEMILQNRVLPIWGLLNCEDPQLNPVLIAGQTLKGKGVVSCNSGFGGINAAVSFWRAEG